MMDDKNLIQDYAFDDCVLTGFEVDKLMSTVSILTEAYYPLIHDKLRQKGLIKIVFSGISKAVIKRTEELDFDIALPYDGSGKDTKASEVYSVTITHSKDEDLQALVDSDMLNLDLIFKNYRIEEVNK